MENENIENKAIGTSFLTKFFANSLIAICIVVSILVKSFFDIDFSGLFSECGSFCGFRMIGIAILLCFSLCIFLLFLLNTFIWYLIEKVLPKIFLASFLSWLLIGFLVSYPPILNTLYSFADFTYKKFELDSNSIFISPVFYIIACLVTLLLSYFASKSIEKIMQQKKCTKKFLIASTLPQVIFIAIFVIMCVVNFMPNSEKFPMIIHDLIPKLILLASLITSFAIYIFCALKTKIEQKQAKEN